jgi:hypothetical protein
LYCSFEPSFIYYTGSYQQIAAARNVIYARTQERRKAAAQLIKPDWKVEVVGLSLAAAAFGSTYPTHVISVKHLWASSGRL